MGAIYIALLNGETLDALHVIHKIAVYYTPDTISLNRMTHNSSKIQNGEFKSHVQYIQTWP